MKFRGEREEFVENRVGVYKSEEVIGSSGDGCGELRKIDISEKGEC